MARASTILKTMANERARLRKAIEAATKHRDEINDQIAELSKELKAVDAYHAAKGDTPPSKAPGKKARPAKKARKASGRRSGIREQVLNKVKAASDGIARGDLLNVMGLKGKKSGEMAVSNALAALKKTGRLLAEDGKYLVGKPV